MKKKRFEICQYGCGRRAKHVFKNGKKCCSAFTAQCPAVSKRAYQGLLKRKWEAGLDQLSSGYVLLTRQKAR